MILSERFMFIFINNRVPLALNKRTVWHILSVSGPTSRIHDRQEIEEYMKLSNDFGCCVELLYDLLRYSLCLLLHFPIDSGTNSLLNYKYYDYA